MVNAECRMLEVAAAMRLQDWELCMYALISHASSTRYALFELLVTCDAHGRNVYNVAKP
jgi:hypothetical protein